MMKLADLKKADRAVYDRCPTHLRAQLLSYVETRDDPARSAHDQANAQQKIDRLPLRPEKQEK